MAMSREIAEYKRKIMSSIINSDEIVAAINAEGITIDNSDELIDNNIFSYDRVPDTEEEVSTYITIQVDIPRIEKGNVFRNVVVLIRIITHQDIMKMTGTSNGNRIDYISAQLDELLNGRSDFGWGKLSLSSNVEWSVDYKHRCRVMQFSVNDLNVACG